MKNVESKNRDRVPKRLGNIQSKPGTLWYRNTTYICQVSRDMGIKNQKRDEEIYVVRNPLHCHKFKVSLKHKNYTRRRKFTRAEDRGENLTDSPEFN